MSTETYFVLVVDDSKDDLYIIERLLFEANLNCVVKCCLSAEAALDYLFEDQSDESTGFPQKPDVILLDLHMPNMNGIEAVVELKKSEKTKDIPIFIFTGEDDANEIKEIYKLGVNGYVPKGDFFKEFLIEKIKDVCR